MIELTPQEQQLILARREQEARGNRGVLGPAPLTVHMSVVCLAASQAGKSPCLQCPESDDWPSKRRPSRQQRTLAVHTGSLQSAGQLLGEFEMQAH